MSYARLIFFFLCVLLVLPAPTEPGFPRVAPSAAPPDDGQWLMPAKNFASSRYSSLDEINVDNVKNLQVSFTFSTGVNKGHEAAPLVVGEGLSSSRPTPTFCMRSTLPSRALQ